MPAIPDSIRDFLACHYRFNIGPVSPFWRHCQNDVDIGNAKAMVDYFQEFGPAGMWGPLLTDPLDGFGTKGYLMILVGQKVPFKMHHAVSDVERTAWAAIRRQHVEAARGAMTVLESLQAMGATGLRVQPRSPVTVVHAAAGV